ncbi:MAG: ATP-binding cassette domain-containing protein [Actinomycetota bacterium]|jgi:ABC-type multidrug transport system ATPase subunit|uniref:ABC transporter ATP-binding protein n=1 Tax=Aquiluna sp. TaxID=2053504 RepID=UPI001DF5B6EF|nr:ATP-binding cassette domain-containing protein [Actinomycetota bacterium]MDA2985826.1 ATP-binding cassette domain-containing protein [Actinomycetota bacterium]NCV35794.1 ATP-binding cassette domain-containing protein [Actinomycetota bacterium]NCV36539.1 ATP-binding cassette domain-containing protein [Actinomycetota bacterium]NCV80488.1 ATP-binding cassette domain-containing protein [Actinomycetota bacterium]
MAQQLAIETSGLTKRFGDQKAVNSISLEVPSGSVFGFLGPNGSGKTTTIRMLLGLAEATEGEIKLLGTEIPKDLEKALPRVGALVEGPAFYPFMSGRNNLLRIDAADRFSDSSTRIERVESALDRVGLHNAGNKKVHAYSLGMKQRLGLANALLKPRDILVLDEPTNGLDPQGTREVRNLIRSLSAEGITIFLSSHLLSEIEMLCSHVAVMSAGKIVAQGLIEDLRNEEPTRLILRTDDVDLAVETLKSAGIGKAKILGDQITCEVDPALDVASLNGKLVRKKVSVKEIRLQRSSLEEKYVKLTGEGFEVVR